MDCLTGRALEQIVEAGDQDEATAVCIGMGCELEAEIADPHGGFTGHRVCHHSDDICCRGFWNAHKDEFAVGQVAQRLGLVEFVEVDTLAGEP